MPKRHINDAALTADIIEPATQYGRYGYRRFAALLHDAGWLVNVKRVERTRRQEGLKVPAKQPKRGRLWMNDGSSVQLRSGHPNHVWSSDFVEDRIVIENWRGHYNAKRPHSSLGYRPSAPVAEPWPTAPAQPASPATSNVDDKSAMHEM